jgi:hypothetical protein
MSADGIATGLNPGEVFLFVSLGTRRFSSSSKWVLVCAVLSDRLTFRINRGDYYYYSGPADMLEQLAASTYFSMWGSVMLTGSSARRSGTLDGEIEIVGAPPRYDRIARCASTAHRFELTR